jgi:hypothetical protein
MKIKYSTFVLLAFIISLSCQSRLKTILYEIDGENRLPLTHDHSYYLEGFRLADTYGVKPFTPGAGKVMVTGQRITPGEKNEIETGLIKAVREIEYRIYVSLPDNITVDSFDIADKSFCRLIGLYELPDRMKHYDCMEGFLVIDTVKSKRFRARLSGKYYNAENDSLIFDGDLNVRLRK